MYQVLSADGSGADGIRPSVAIVDELHRWSAPRERTLFDVIRSGTISRPGSLIIQISTAGGAQHESDLCWQAHQRAAAWIAGGSKGGNFYAQIHSCDQKRLGDNPTYWRSRAARVAANPSHEDRGGHLKDSKIAAFIERMPKGIYCRYHLNC
jgi:phage terminase large subunit-like protein